MPSDGDKPDDDAEAELVVLECGRHAFFIRVPAGAKLHSVGGRADIPDKIRGLTFRRTIRIAEGTGLAVFVTTTRQL